MTYEPAPDHCALAIPWPNNWDPRYYAVDLLQVNTELVFSDACLSAWLWLDFTDGSTVRVAHFSWN